MSTRTPLAVEEWYHCYNRGVDKRRVFNSVSDYERFISLLYLCNATERLHASDFKSYTLEELFHSYPPYRGELLVEIGSWCLMPNHVHLLLKENVEKGIALFMQKVFTGYTMYFNKKHERTGPLFSGRFKSKHVTDDIYLKRLVSYIHLNPIELMYPAWEEGRAAVHSASHALDRHRFSSLHAFERGRDLFAPLLGNSIWEVYDSIPSRKEMLKEARKYFQEKNVKVEP